MDTTAIAWTIWTLNEPANYVIAACLPTLRPIFIRVLPASFFLLSKQSSNKKSQTSSIKISWPRGSFKPSFRLETNTRVANTDSRLSGPWNGTRLEAESDAKHDIGLVEKCEMHMQGLSVGKKDVVDVMGSGPDFVESVVEVDSLKST